MLTRTTSIARPAVTQRHCPACGWFSEWLGRLGFRVGERIRVIEAYRFVALVAGDESEARDLPAAPPAWPWVLAQAEPPASSDSAPDPPAARRRKS